MASQQLRAMYKIYYKKKKKGKKWGKKKLVLGGGLCFSSHQSKQEAGVQEPLLTSAGAHAQLILSLSHTHTQCRQ